jgi:hypothetical protein
MAVENGWGQGAVNNSNDYGKAKVNSTNGFGKIYESTNAGLTNIVGGNPVVSISYAFNSFCADASDPTPTVQNNAGAGTFSSTTGLVINSTTGVIDIDASTASTYTVTYTDTDAATAIFDLTIHALPTVTVSVSAGTICNGESTTITASGAASYSWSNGSTGNSITVSPTTTTTFTATGTDSNGCVSSGATTITVNALPTVEITGTLTYCAGSTTTLTATAGLSSYLWSTGATTQAINVTAGSYTVTGTDSNGCSNTSAQVTVTELPLDSATVTYSASAYCQVPTGALAVEGYYPLYTTESAARAESSDGTAHSHTLSGTTYYMPNDGVIVYHGTYSLTTPAPTITGQSGTFSASPLFTPLLDTYTGSKIAYSLRKLDSNYTGNVIRVRRSSDNSEQDIGFTNNELDTTTLLSFVGSNDGFVTTWYDQSGNTNNASIATAINQPLIVSSGVVNTLNGKPSIKFDGNVKLIIATNNFNQSNSVDYTILTVSNMTSLPPDNTPNGGSHVFGVGSSSSGYFTTYGDKIGFAYNGGSPVTNYTSGRPSQQILQDTNVVSLNSTQLSIYTRGSGTNTLSSNNNTPVTNTQTANPYPYTTATIGASSGGGNNVYSSRLVGNISECVLWWTNFNSDRTDIKNNLNSFYTIY